ncbi:MAG TPA: hypothetical protein VK539_08880 [Myxococcaceae bacterium]|nr:hypothetical protein [Myxococcaceae bacterium]
MTPLQQFSLAPVPLAPEDSDATVELLSGGRATGRFLAGKALERQFQAGNAYLLLVTQDVPHEETLFIYLLDRSWKLLDMYELGAAYVPGLLQHVQVVSDRQLEFSFFGNERWRLTVLDTPVRRWRDVFRSPLIRPWERLLSPRYLELRRLEEPPP